MNPHDEPRTPPQPIAIERAYRPPPMRRPQPVMRSSLVFPLTPSPRQNSAQVLEDAMSLSYDSDDSEEHSERGSETSDTPECLLIGISSDVGRTLAPKLVKEGYGLRAMLANPDEEELCFDLGCEVLGFTDAEAGFTVRSVVKIGRGCEFAIHMRPYFAYFDPTARALRHAVNQARVVAEGCRLAGIRKLVVVCPEVSLFTGAPVVNVTAGVGHPPNPRGTAAKIMQQVERAFLDATCLTLGFEVLIVRTRMLWGELDTHLLPGLRGKAQKRRLDLVADGDFLTSTCHLENAAEGVVCALARGEGGNCYNITDGKPILFRDFMRDLLAATGFRVPARELFVRRLSPRSLSLEHALKVAEQYELVGSPVCEPKTTREQIGLQGLQITLDDTKARSEILYHPRVSRAEGLRRIANEYMKRDEAASAAAAGAAAGSAATAGASAAGAAAAGAAALAVQR